DLGEAVVHLQAQLAVQRALAVEDQGEQRLDARRAAGDDADRARRRDGRRRVALWAAVLVDALRPVRERPSLLRQTARLVVRPLVQAAHDLRAQTQGV